MTYRNKASLQLVLFMLIGFIQFGLDAALLWLMVALKTPVELANVASRAIAACAGLYLNKTFTFQLSENKTGAPFRLYARFWIFWSLMTVLSTALLKSIPSIFSFQYAEKSFYIVITKISIEFFLFILSFLLSRKLVFRNA